MGHRNKISETPDSFQVTNIDLSGAYIVFAETTLTQVLLQSSGLIYRPLRASGPNVSSKFTSTVARILSVRSRRKRLGNMNGVNGFCCERLCLETWFCVVHRNPVGRRDPRRSFVLS